MRTTLISMPFVDDRRPSIQLGILAQSARADGFPVRTRHANLDLAVRLGPDIYRALCEHRGAQVGDWLFSVEAFGPRAPDPHALGADEFAAEFDVDDANGHPARPGACSPRVGAAHLRHIRRIDVPAYLDELVDQPGWDEVDVLAFTCTFQQTVASIALTRRLRARWPGLRTVFGGANLDGPMGVELVRSCTEIDVGVTGDGEHAFSLVLDAFAARRDPSGVPGSVVRVGGDVVTAPAGPAPPGLDHVPVPDYDEYFAHAEELGLLAHSSHGSVWLPFESARGCWWGQKHHCTFCGLNGATMRFRAKSGAAVLSELDHQARRYRSFRFTAVDNIIDPAYLRDLLPALTEAHSDYELFYEVKANLDRDDVRTMALAGVRQFQPGIESLSSRVLALMDKGVRAGQNVNLLRWARYYGIDVAWNILWGFPGEVAADYVAQSVDVPHLVHLAPPAGAARIWLERFSPLFERAEPAMRRPHSSYGLVYPATLNLDAVAYFFTGELPDSVDDISVAPLIAAIELWQRAWREEPRPSLTHRAAPGLVEIADGRHVETQGRYVFEGDLAEIYLACVERPITAAAVHRRMVDVSSAVVDETLAAMSQRGLIHRDGDFWLALSIPYLRGR